MSSHPLAGDYLQWLASQIRGENDGNPNRTYGGLITIMHEAKFEDLVPNDENRIGDGLDLRVEFCYAQNVPTTSLQDLGPCSFLEVLIALSRRLEFAAGGTPPGWAWKLVSNLELHRITDPVGRRKTEMTHEILRSCIFRDYAPNGEGGFFPLKRPDEDQTRVEIWYQMAAYIAELER